MDDFDNEEEQRLEAEAEKDNLSDHVFKKDFLKEKYFKYLLNEMKRERIPLNKKVYDEINAFMKTERGKNGFNMFKFTKLPNYCK